MFRENIEDHSARVTDMLATHPDIAKIEERTKGSLIEPLLRCLGFDPNDPGHVMREAATDSGKKRVDYMLTGRGKRQIAVEAKSASTKLSVADIQQLQDYFTYSEAVAAILTNGVDYWLFTDLDKSNVMDTEPYLQVDIRKITNHDIRHLECLARSGISQERIHELAEREQQRSLINSIVAQELDEPSTEFLKMVGKKAEIKRLTKATLESIRPLVVRAIDRHLSGNAASDPTSRSPITGGSGTTKPKTTTGDSSVGVTPRRFQGATLFGEPLDCNNYSRMLVSVVKEMQARHPISFAERVNDGTTFKGRKWWYVSRNIIDLSPNPSHSKSEIGGYWIDLHLNAKNKVKRAHLFLRAFGHSSDDLEIHISDG